MSRHEWQPTSDGSWDGGIWHMGQDDSAHLWAPPWWWFLTNPSERSERLVWSRRWRPWKVWMWPRYLLSRATNTVTWLEGIR